MQANVYVEFGKRESLEKGLGLNNQLYKDKIIRVKEVDKLEKQEGVQEEDFGEQDEEDKGADIYVTGLNGQLAELQDQDLRILFKSFGEIKQIQVLQNKQLKQAYAVIRFNKAQDANMAMEAMNGFKFNNQLLCIQ